MPCRNIGADILDSTNQNTFSFGVIEEEDTWWNLCPEQKQHFDYMSHLNRYLTEEYHSIAGVFCDKDLLCLLNHKFLFISRNHV
jgi:hypothetical protein